MPASGDNLVFGSQTIATYNNGDIYNRLSMRNPAQLDLARVTFPGSAGAELRVIGNQQAAANSLVISYGFSRGNPSVIYKGPNMSDMESFLNTIDTFRTNEDNLIGTLSDSRDGSAVTYTGMYWASWNVSDIYSVSHTPPGGSVTDEFCVFFEATFIRVTVP